VTGAVVALGATQIIGYGTLYYSLAILAPGIAAEFGVAREALFAAFSAGLLASGLAAPWIGRAMDARGAAPLMAGGSLMAAALLAAAAAAPSAAVWMAVVVALELVGALVLYDAAFAALTERVGAEARRRITQLTLIAGFASTLFWPLTGWLDATLGWRGTYVAFAALHLSVALPLHLTLAHGSRVARRTAAPAAPTLPPALEGDEARRAFRALATSFALSGVLITALGVHMVPILTATGLGAGAYAAAMAMGPAQVAIRLTDALFWKGLHPLTVAAVSALALPAAIGGLFLGLPALAAGVLFAALFGVGQGLSSIVRGTAPLALFGARGYAETLGRLAAVRTLPVAAAPALYAAAEGAIGTGPTLAAAAAIGAAAAWPLLALRARLARAGRLGLA
jgi:MFS family permease